MARTTDMGLRREPQPPMPIVMPERELADHVVDVVRLSPWPLPPRACPPRASRRTRPAARRPRPARGARR